MIMRKRSASIEEARDEREKRPHSRTSSSHAYLETIDVKRLDFDLEKICSVTLSPLNVYCCLVCGKYFQGRSEKSVAFLHSIQESHHVFMNLSTLRAYVLPENSEIVQVQLLDNIRFAVCPTYTPEVLRTFPRKCFDLSNIPYTNGYIGLTDSGDNTHFAVIVQMMAHITPLRDFLLLTPQASIQDELIKRFALILKKLWSPLLLRAHLSPYELLQQLALTSDKRSKLLKQKDPKVFLLWLLNYLSTTIPSLKKELIENIRGEVEVSSITLSERNGEDGGISKFVKDADAPTVKRTKFWNLSLDLPPVSFLNKGGDTKSIPQVELEALLDKFGGSKEIHTRDGIRTYKIVKSPHFLIIHINRFDFSAESPIKNRNRTLVKFPEFMRVGGHTYKLIANVTHDLVKSDYSDDSAPDDRARWKIQLLKPKEAEWVEIRGRDVIPKEKELLFLDESYLQVWEMNRGKQ